MADLVPGGELLIGRDVRCEIPVPDEGRLSRRAVRLRSRDGGVVVTNLSHTHAVLVDAHGTVSRLEPVGPEGADGGFVLRAGSARLTGPSWGRSPFAVWITVEGAHHRTVLPGWTAGGVSVTAEPLRLQRRTKEFVVALLLCRHRLEDPTSAAPPPPVPKLARDVLEATNSWHLVRDYDVDERTRLRLTRRMHEHLKTLRAKVVRSGLAEEGAELPPMLLVSLLLDSGAVRRDDLALLSDEAWLERQEQQWWDA
ncbi:FHA domain-containing protein [Actinomycetospora sp. CA-084318]|uniref:FHA domain-containing protein n=1 Tax=Actinomycetospora sp. CA-084318 TaxID=3239892 RepID=UPI003D978BC4